MASLSPSRHFYELGLELLREGRKELALARFLSAAQADPQDAAPYLRAIDLLIELDRPKEAIALSRDIFARYQDIGQESILACPLPAIPAEGGDVDAALAYFESRLSELTHRPGLRIGNPDLAQPRGHFLLPYHDRPVRGLREAMAAFFLKAHPELAFAAPGAQRAPAVTAHPKLGVACGHLTGHTVGQITNPLLEALTDLGVELHLFVTHDREDEAFRRLKSKAASCRLLPPDLALARRMLADARLDALLYPEIGMGPFIYCLAFARFAPLQMMMWGHPMTSGLPSIDVFISSSLIEPENAQAHYTERLLQLPVMPIVAADHYLQDPPGREALGLPLNKRLYVCPQSLFKLSPAFDSALARILAADSQGELVLVEGQKPEWKDRLSHRLAHSLGEAMARVRFLPQLERRHFIGLLAAADVLLDPFGFSGGNTSAEALANGTPIVTLPGRTMAGRVTYGFLQQLGAVETVAADAGDYVRLALAAAREKPRHREILMRSKPRLFGRTDAAKLLADFLGDPLTFA
jgi:predicted O-linked N-acetylglucosamine transferase (SPINDLY family)